MLKICEKKYIGKWIDTIGRIIRVKKEHGMYDEWEDEWGVPWLFPLQSVYYKKG